MSTEKNQSNSLGEMTPLESQRENNVGETNSNAYWINSLKIEAKHSEKSSIALKASGATLSIAAGTYFGISSIWKVIEGSGSSFTPTELGAIVFTVLAGSMVFAAGLVKDGDKKHFENEINVIEDEKQKVSGQHIVGDNDRS